MNQDTKLKLQAYLDNELSQRDSRQVSAWLDHDPEAQALYAELNELKTVLVQNELEVKVPDSREFYWSKIERAIHQSSREPAQAWWYPSYRRWMRILAPAAGVAVLLMTVLSVVKLSNSPSRLSYVNEIEMPLEDTTAISFHSQSAGMTVVWVQSEAPY